MEGDRFRFKLTCRHENNNVNFRIGPKNDIYLRDKLHRREAETPP